MPLRGHHELPHLVGVGHTARFKNVDAAVAFAVEFEIANENPSVDERGDADLGLLELFP